MKKLKGYFNLIYLFLFASLATNIALITSTSLFLSKVGASHLGNVYQIYSVVLMLFSIIAILIKRKNTIKLLNIAIIFTILSFIFTKYTNWEYANYIPIIMSNFIYWIFLIYLWNIALDICNIKQAKFIFPYLIATYIIGATISGLSSMYLPNIISNIGIIISAISFIISLIILNTIPHGYSDNEKSPNPKLLIDFIKSNKLFIYISIMVILFAISLTSLEFIFNTAIETKYIKEISITAFLGKYQLIQNAMVLAINLTIAKWLLKRFSFTFNLLFLPIIFLLGFIGLSIFPVFQLIIGFKLIRDISGNSIFEATYPMLYEPIDSTYREKMLVLADGFFTPLGFIIGGFLVNIYAYLNTTQWGIIGIVASSFMLLSFIAMARQYKIVMQSSIKKIIEANIILKGNIAKNINLKNPYIRAVFINGLSSQNANYRLLSFELMSNITNDKKTIKALFNAFKTSPDNIKIKMIEILLKKEINKNLLNMLYDSLEQFSNVVKNDLIVLLAYNGFSKVKRKIKEIAKIGGTREKLLILILLLLDYKIKNRMKYFFNLATMYYNKGNIKTQKTILRYIKLAITIDQKTKIFSTKDKKTICKFLISIYKQEDIELAQDIINILSTINIIDATNFIINEYIKYSLIRRHIINNITNIEPKLLITSLKNSKGFEKGYNIDDIVCYVANKRLIDKDTLLKYINKRLNIARLILAIGKLSTKHYSSEIYEIVLHDIKRIQNNIVKLAMVYQGNMDCKDEISLNESRESLRIIELTFDFIGFKNRKLLEEINTYNTIELIDNKELLLIKGYGNFTDILLQNILKQ